MYRLSLLYPLWLVLIGIGGCFASSCQSDKPPVAPAVTLRDSIPAMVSYGVSKLISDSGMIRYKVIAEEWKVYDRTNPDRQTFEKGLLLEKFNQKLHIQMYITADTAFWYGQDLWELRGRVKVWNEDGIRFSSELLYWNMSRHEFYSNKYSHLVTPDREVQGQSFHSNEQMTRYEVNITTASFPLPEEQVEEESEEPLDSVQVMEKKQAEKEKHELRPQRVMEKPDPNKPQGGHFR